MNPMFCEVIGCLQPAAWVRVSEDGGLLEDYLCDRCYGSLRGRSPDHSHCYAPLEHPTEEWPRNSLYDNHDVSPQDA